MNREQFMKRLATRLTALGIGERDDILYDYEEHFRAGLEAGKTEEEIAFDLGDPEELAQTFADDRAEAQQNFAAQNSAAQNNAAQNGAAQHATVQRVTAQNGAAHNGSAAPPSGAQNASGHASGFAKPAQSAPCRRPVALIATGLFFLDICLAFPLAVTLVALAVSVFVVFLAIACAAVVLLVNTFPIALPYMPDLARIFLGVSLAGLSVLSFTGFLGMCKANGLAFGRYARWHRRAVKGGNAA